MPCLGKEHFVNVNMSEYANWIYSQPFLLTVVVMQSLRPYIVSHCSYVSEEPEQLLLNVSIMFKMDS